MNAGGLVMRLVDWCAVMFFVFVVSFLLACGGGGEATSAAPGRGNFGEGIVARAGAEPVTAEGVARIAQAQHLDVSMARELAIRDALFASEARATGVSSSTEVQQRASAVLARRLLRALLVEAERMGPTTDAELAEVMKRRWLELDRPEGFRTVHAVVRFQENADTQTRGRAEAVAKAIEQAIEPVRETARKTPLPTPADVAAGVKDPVITAFRDVVDRVGRDGFEVVVEDLAPVAADGRSVVLNGGSLVPPFAKAASLLVQRGDTSPPVVTQYGVHVIMLLERTPSSIVPVEERRKMVRDEVVWSRAFALRAKLLNELRREVLVERSADALLALVSIER